MRLASKVIGYRRKTLRSEQHPIIYTHNTFMSVYKRSKIIQISTHRNYSQISLYASNLRK